MEKQGASTVRTRSLTVLLVTVGTILLGLAAPACATAAPHHKYVLKHPKREHCKAHYVKKVKRVKARRKGRVVRVRKTFCVWVAPRKAGTPVQPTPPAPQPTTTTLTVKPRGCEFFSYEFGATAQICEYILIISVSDNAGVSIPSPTTTLVFTNAAKPGESWTVPGAAEVGIVSDFECFKTCVTSIYRTTLDALGHVRKIEIASVPWQAGGAWTVIATYGGSAEYSGSSSAPQTL